MALLENSTSKTHQIINTVLLSIIGIVAGLIYTSNVTINTKIDSLMLDNQSNKQEINFIKSNYETKLDNQMQHKELEAKINLLKIKQ